MANGSSNGNGKVGIREGLKFHKDPLKFSKKKKKENGKRRGDFFDPENPAFELVIMTRYVPISMY